MEIISAKLSFVIITIWGVGYCKNRLCWFDGSKQGPHLYLWCKTKF